jgi:hypothetical protein
LWWWWILPAALHDLVPDAVQFISDQVASGLLVVEEWYAK